MPERVTFSIEWGTIVRVVAALLILALLWFIRDIVLILLSALVFGSAIETWAKAIRQRLRLPYRLGVILLYAVALLAMSLVVYIVVPIFLTEVKAVLPKLDTLLQGTSSLDSSILQSLSLIIREQANRYLINITPVIFDVFGGFASALLIFVISFYLAIREDGAKNLLKEIIPSPYTNRVLKVWLISQGKFSRWLRGQLTLMVAVGLLTYIAMFMLGVPHPALIGITSSITEVIPFFGPILAAIFALTLAVVEDVNLALGVVIAFFIIQTIENYILVPVIMQGATAMHPIPVLIGIMVGGKLAGVLGILIAVPIISVLMEIYKEAKMQPATE